MSTVTYISIRFNLDNGPNSLTNLFSMGEKKVYADTIEDGHSAFETLVTWELGDSLLIGIVNTCGTEEDRNDVKARINLLFKEALPAMGVGVPEGTCATVYIDPTTSEGRIDSRLCRGLSEAIDGIFGVKPKIKMYNG